MKDIWSENFEPYQGGGDMIEEVNIASTTFAKGYHKFEAGTPPIAQVIGLGSSIDFVNSLNLDKVFEHEKEVHDYTLNKWKDFNNLSVYGGSKNKGAIISFNIKGIHANDLSMVLDQSNIAIRTGHHCAQPLMKYLNISSSARASFGVYNNKTDSENFIDSLKDSIKFLTS